ncbi:MAG: type II toxin-antitoxin system RelE/ParE family toxin [Desulfobacteraceae bacterium]|nr:type II toxin-antitoxin system RelE/ParE family toxin [Desulfobacteraceae bacterium]MBC2721029.1 type II toxin-antitoxin system RelE/ParE family toxin [Desulfobacteraceae bacterium]
METISKAIKEYLNSNGKNPFRAWLESLKDTKARAKIRIRINRIRLGNMGDYKSVGNGVYELRIDYGPGYRIYFGEKGKILVILLCGGNKRTQSSDIEKAQGYWKDYKRRKK